MAKLACPYCYHRIDGARLWYQCTGRPRPGRTGCVATVDEARRDETGFNQAVLPSFPPSGRIPLPISRQATCPTCEGQTGIRVCPCCHTPVSANFGGSQSPLIAMVGAKGTGKTVYLMALAHELRHSLRRRFAADVRLINKPIDFNPDDLIRARNLVEQTRQAKAGRSEPIVFEWRQESKLAGFMQRYQTTYLSFYDTAGEDLTALQTTYDLTYLGAADALILLLDPFQIPQARGLIKIPDSAVQSNELTVDVVNRVTEKLRTTKGRVGFRGNIKIPVAVAFAKIDAFFHILGDDHPLRRQPEPSFAYDELAGQQTHEYVRAMLHEWGADDIDTHLRMNYTNFRYFAVSSLGAEPDYEADRQAAPVSESGVRPFRVDEPLVWLLSQFHVVPSRADQR
jgi:hypothetical protein